MNPPKNNRVDGTLRAREPFNVLIARRIFQLRRKVRLDTQRLRTRTIEQLDLLFAFATKIASGEMKRQRVDGERRPITLKQRQMWARIAAYVAQIINAVATRVDERQIDRDMNRLEVLIHKATPTDKAEQPGEGVPEKPTEQNTSLAGQPA